MMKLNLLSRKFYTFIKLSCKKKTSSLVFIEMLRNNRYGMTNQFIHLCTGEDDQSYKNFVQVGVSNEGDGCCSFNDCIKLSHVIPEPGIPIYDRDIEGDYEDGILRSKIPSVPFETVFVEHFYMKGWFTLVTGVEEPKSRNFIGRIISPENLSELLYHDDVPKVKILDSGISVRV